MKLGDYFARDKKEFLKPTPVTGERTDWLDFCELVLKIPAVNFVATDLRRLIIPSPKLLETGAPRGVVAHTIFHARRALSA